MKNYKSILNKNEAFVFERIYGIGCERQTQKEIAESMGVKRQRVQQIGQDVLKKMREFVMK